MKDLFEGLAVIAGFTAFLFVFAGFMTMMSDMASNISAHSRCSARGFDNYEVIVHYPTFWNVDTTCYGEGRKDGVKL